MQEELRELIGITGPFDIEAFCKHCSSTPCPTQLTDLAFVSTNVAAKSVWIHPDKYDIVPSLQHYFSCKAEAPYSTSACILLPARPGQNTPWLRLLKGMELLKVYYNHDRLYLPAPGQTKRPYAKAMEVWYDAPAYDMAPGFSLPKSALLTQDRPVWKALSKARTARATTEHRTMTIPGSDAVPEDMLFLGRIGAQPVVTLLDSGATILGMISEPKAQQLGLAILPTDGIGIHGLADVHRGG